MKKLLALFILCAFSFNSYSAIRHFQATDCSNAGLEFAEASTNSAIQAWLDKERATRVFSTNAVILDKGWFGFCYYQTVWYEVADAKPR